MARRALGFLVFALLAPSAYAVACAKDGTVRYFYGATGNNYVNIGTPIIGRVHCLWSGSSSTLPVFCPFYLRIDSGGFDISNIQFGATPLGNWDCSGPAHSGSLGSSNYCWYTSAINEGPSIMNQYKMTDGSANISWYMVWLGNTGSSGQCNQKGSQCGTHTYLCPVGYGVKPSEVSGVGGCQSKFCDTATFSAGCCSPLCAAGYGSSVGTCARGFSGGSYAHSCAGFTCTAAADNSTCCQSTQTCIPGAQVETFGRQSTGNFVNVGSPPMGKVHCLWQTVGMPPIRCPYYARLDAGGSDTSNMIFATVSSDTVNCAREGGTGTRYCWYTQHIKNGPSLLDRYDTQEGETGLGWHTVYYNAGTFWSACHQGDINCGHATFVCGQAVTGGLNNPNKTYGPGNNPSHCQAKFCHLSTFAFGCCFTTTTTTTTFSTNTSTTTSTSTTNITTTINTSTTTTADTTTTNVTTVSTTTTSTTTSSNTTTTSTTTLNMSLFGDDPITWFGNESREFWLPTGVLMPILYTKEISMLGSTFPGNPYEQWFDRIVITGPDGFQLAEVVIKKDIASFNKTKHKGKQCFETLDVTVGAEESPLKVMPKPNWFFRRWDVHVGIAKIDQIFQYGPHLRTQQTIGGARREVVQIRCKSAHILIVSSPATEYFGAHAYLAAKYAHLDVVILEMHDKESLRGVLPELWGFRPISNSTKALLSPPWAQNQTNNTSSNVPSIASAAMLKDGLGVIDSKEALQI